MASWPTPRCKSLPGVAFWNLPTTAVCNILEKYFYYKYLHQTFLVRITGCKLEKADVLTFQIWKSWHIHIPFIHKVIILTECKMSFEREQQVKVISKSPQPFASQNSRPFLVFSLELSAIHPAELPRWDKSTKGKARAGFSEIPLEILVWEQTARGTNHIKN